MTPPPLKKTKKVSGDQGYDLQYPIPGLGDDLQQKFSQERILSEASTNKFISILNRVSMKLHSKLGNLLKI